MNRIDNNSGERAFWTIMGLIVLAGIWLWRLINNMAASLAVEPGSAGILLLGGVILLIGGGAAAMFDWGWKGLLRIGSVCTVSLIPAIRDWTLMQPSLLGMHLSGYEEARRSFCGHGLVLTVFFAGLIGLVWYCTSEE